jgi:hypothetical protein
LSTLRGKFLSDSRSQQQASKDDQEDNDYQDQRKPINEADDSPEWQLLTNLSFQRQQC